MSSMFPIVNLLINLSSVAVLWIGADRIARGDIQVGSLVAYLSYLVQILLSVMMATFMVSMIPRASVAAERIQEVLDTAPSRRAARADPVHRRSRGHGRARAPRRRLPLPGRRARRCSSDISFTTAAGHDHRDRRQHRRRQDDARQPRARGCSTPPSGAVLVGGVDVRELDPDVLWRTIGLVPQKPYLFSGTVASNLRYGKPDATEDEMWEALEVAQADDFVRAMPGGLEARIEQGGTNVSGGQRQRLVDRPGARPQARHLPVRRLVLGPRPRHRRPPAGRARRPYTREPRW